MMINYIISYYLATFSVTFYFLTTTSLHLEKKYNDDVRTVKIIDPTHHIIVSMLMALTLGPYLGISLLKFHNRYKIIRNILKIKRGHYDD